MVCENCDGSGTTWKFSWTWPLRVAKVKCPHCKGTGRDLGIDRMANEMIRQYMKRIRADKERR